MHLASLRFASLRSTQTPDDIARADEKQIMNAINLNLGKAGSVTKVRKAKRASLVTEECEAPCEIANTTQLFLLALFAALVLL